MHTRDRRLERPLLVIGQFPPPLNGQSVMMEKTALRLEARQPVRRVSTGKGSPSSKIAGHFNAARIVLFSRGETAAYSSPPGHRGVWLFLGIVLAARLRRIRLFVHHHSFRPIAAGPLTSMRLLAWIGGRHLSHIFLSESMRERFLETYPGARRNGAAVLPNAFAYPPAPPLPRPPGTVTPCIGHISVLTREKGVARVIAIFERLREQGREVRLLLAGPVADRSLNAPIEAAKARFGGAFEYRGAIYGPAKAEFFRDLDLLLLPSTLLDEADPLVIQEAYEAGAAVMASDRGCIAERLVSAAAILSLDLEQDTAAVAAFLDQMRGRAEQVRDDNRAHALKMHREALLREATLWAELQSLRGGS